MQISEEKNIFVEWFLWQFYEAPKFLLEVWKNYLLFASNFFSFPLLVKTFFSPWRRYNWVYPKRFDVVEFFNTLISNIFSRFIGAVIRVVLIIMGLALQLFVFFAGIIIFIFWILVPFIILAGIFYAF